MKVILLLTAALLCLNINAQEKHKGLSSKTQTGNKKVLETVNEKDEKQTINESSESRFFNSFVHSNTFNEFVEDGAPSGNTAFTVVNEKVEIAGSKFLQKTWENRATIRTLGGKQLTLKNVNFEIDEGTFALENKGVLFLIDGNKYGEIIFNGVSFKYLYNPLTKETRYQEVLAENNNFMIVKDYYLEIREIGGQGARSYAGSRGNKSYRKKFRYYLMMKDHFSEFKRKKSVVLDLLGEKANEIETYVEENDLSYKKDQDLKKIFKFYNSL